MVALLARRGLVEHAPLVVRRVEAHVLATREGQLHDEATVRLEVVCELKELVGSAVGSVHARVQVLLDLQVSVRVKVGWWDQW